MLDRLSMRLLTVLQLTRMALVFTAASNSLCTLILDAAANGQPPSGRRALLVTLISMGLYGFGMSLNDIIDRRRDQQLAAHRPLPSGRIHLLTAHLVSGMLLIIALAAGLIYARLLDRWNSAVLILGTAGLIVSYDFAGKYLLSIGLITLGAIRFSHALIPAPAAPLLWHPLLLFIHVTLLSIVAYDWEQKRPALKRRNWAVVLGVVAAVTAGALALGLVGALRTGAPGWLWRPGLLLPIGLAAAFLLVGRYIRRTSPTPRQAGQTLMLTGLLWLILYDAAFAAIYAGARYSLLLLAMAPLSYLMVLLMRWWSTLVLLSQQPDYKRAHTGRMSP